MFPKHGRMVGLHGVELLEAYEMVLKLQKMIWQCQPTIG